MESPWLLGDDLAEDIKAANQSTKLARSRIMGPTTKPRRFMPYGYGPSFGGYGMHRSGNTGRGGNKCGFLGKTNGNVRSSELKVALVEKQIALTNMTPVTCKVKSKMSINNNIECRKRR